MGLAPLVKAVSSGLARTSAARLCARLDAVNFRCDLMWLAACIPHSLGGLERLRQGHQGTERRGSVHRWNGQYLMHQRARTPARKKLGATTTVRLKVEQIQLVSGVRRIGMGQIGLQGA